jgi:hypothetical protein
VTYPHILTVKGGPLIWLSGAIRSVLDQAPTERNKFVGLGGTVLTTCSLATVSCAFALVVGVHAPVWAAIPISALWGLAIMNLDRWLVAGTPRREKWYQNLLMVVPRFLLALIIGGVISTPLVLWIFDREISAELKVLSAQKANAFTQQLDLDERYKAIPTLEAEVTKLQSIVDGTSSALTTGSPEIAALRAQYNGLDSMYRQAQQAAICEHDGTCGTGVQGNGPEYREKLAYAESVKAERDVVKQQLDVALQGQSTAMTAARISAAEQLKHQQADLNQVMSQRKAEEQAFALRNAEAEGLLSRLEALSNLTARNSTLKLAYLALATFIAAIEILPVFVKFLMSLGPPSLYDRVLAESDRTRMTEVEGEHAYREEAAKTELDARLRAHREVAEDLAEDAVAADAEVRRFEIQQHRHRRLSRTRTVDRGPDGQLRPIGTGRPLRYDSNGRAVWPTPEREEAAHTIGRDGAASSAGRGGASGAASADGRVSALAEDPRWGIDED